MSLVEKLSKDTTNQAKHPKSELWDTLSVRKGNQEDLLKALREGSEAQHEVKAGEGCTLILRILTISEEAALNSFVAEVMKYYPYTIDSEHRADVEAIERMKLKVMMASTKPNKRLGASLLNYNADAQLTYLDVSTLTLSELHFILKEYQSLESKYNPSLETLPEKDLVEVIDFVKKSVIQPKDLSYSILLGGFKLLIQQQLQEDKVFSQLQSTSQENS